MVFRVTRIDLDGKEDVSAVHAVADEETLEVLRQLTDSEISIYGREGRHAANVLLRLPVRAFAEAYRASGRIPGNAPQYRPGLNDSMARVYFGLISDE